MTIRARCFLCLVLMSLLFIIPHKWATPPAVGKTKPNVSIIDEKYRPTKKVKNSQGYLAARGLLLNLSEKNGLLAGELGKLPELQDGIASSEAAALEKLMKLYEDNPNAFDHAFQEMYQK